MLSEANNRGQSRVIMDLEFNAEFSEVFSYLGYSNGSFNVWPRIYALLEETYIEFREHAETRCVYCDFMLETLPEVGTLFGPGDLDNLWGNALEITLMAVTLGYLADEFVSDLLLSRQYAKAFVADAVGSAAADFAIEHVSWALKNRDMRAEKNPSPRFDPGYGDLPLQFQKELTSPLGAYEIRIQVAEGYMLKLRKSVTDMVAWLGLSDLEDICSEPITTMGCDLCDYETCRFWYKESGEKSEKGRV